MSRIYDLTYIHHLTQQARTLMIANDYNHELVSEAENILSATEARIKAEAERMAAAKAHAAKEALCA